MIDHDNLEEFRDPQIYDLQDEGYYDDYPLTEQWARAWGASSGSGVWNGTYGPSHGGTWLSGDGCGYHTRNDCASVPEGGAASRLD